MPKHKNDRLQGTLDLLVLKTLAALGPMHGYGITLHIERVSKDALRLEEGSLYPALHRMTQSGWPRSEWRASENNRRARFYSITAAGRRQLADEAELDAIDRGDAAESASHSYRGVSLSKEHLMAWIDRLVNLLRGGRLDAEIDEELAFHLESLIRDNPEKGMPLEAARQEAGRRFGAGC